MPLQLAAAKPLPPPESGDQSTSLESNPAISGSTRGPPRDITSTFPSSEAPSESTAEMDLLATISVDPEQDSLCSSGSVPTPDYSGSANSNAPAPPSMHEVPDIWSQAPRPNKYESCVDPDERCVLDDNLLLCTPYIINTKYMVLICTHCKRAVRPDSAAKHARKIHPHCKVAVKFTAQLHEKYPGLATGLIRPDDLVEPIFGLAVPLDMFVICGRCRHGYSNMDSWHKHICKKAEMELHGQPTHFSSLVQTFFHGKHLSYFPVKTPMRDADAPTTDDYTIFKSQTSGFDAAFEDKVVEPEDYRELNQFLSKEGWIAHISDCSVSELVALTSLPSSGGDPLNPLRQEVLALMSNIQSVIENAGFHVRRLLGRRPP
jgi:hypothetical protein